MQKNDFKGQLGDWYTKRLVDIGSKSKRVGQDLLVSQLELLPRHPTNILEIGCGVGWRISELKKFFQCNAVGIDPSQRAIEAAKNDYPPPKGRYFKSVPLIN